PGLPARLDGARPRYHTSIVPTRTIERGTAHAGFVHPRFLGLLHQLQPLHYAEAMLLVHHHQAEIFEFHVILNQSVRSYDQLRIALRDVAAHVAFSVLLERAG